MSIKINRNLQTGELTDLTDEELSVINKSTKCNVWRDDTGTYLFKRGTEEPLGDDYFAYFMNSDNYFDTSGVAIYTDPNSAHNESIGMTTKIVISGEEWLDIDNEIAPNKQTIIFKNQTMLPDPLLVDNPIDGSFTPEQAKRYQHRNCVVVANQSAQRINEDTGKDIRSDKYIYKILCGVKSKSDEFLYHNEYVDPAAIMPATETPTYVTLQLTFSKGKELIKELFGTDISTITSDTVQYRLDLTIAIDLSGATDSDSLKSKLKQGLFNQASSIMLPIMLASGSVRGSGCVYFLQTSDGFYLSPSSHASGGEYISWSDINYVSILQASFPK